MSEQILKALMQLFAIIARPESSREDRRIVVESFLKRQLNSELVEEYLKVFDQYYLMHQEKQKEEGTRRRVISASSVKVLKICTEINEELAQNQKIIVLIRLLEFVKSDNSEISSQEMEFITTVAETFNIPNDEFTRIKEFVLFPFDAIQDSSHVLIIDEKNEEAYKGLKTKHIKEDAMQGQIRVLSVPSTNMYFIRYIGVNEIYMNGQMIEQDKVYPFNYGSSIRNQQINPIYYSDVVSRFTEDIIKSKILFEVKDVEFKFKSGKKGLHHVSFSEVSGRLIGIMGASGAGKSTLLNVLNGSTPPTSGEVLINGISINSGDKRIEGVIGHVSQDDLLIEELSVFQNLYYNAKLCFGDYNQEQLTEIVHKVLKNLGLFEIKDIQVGSPLNKKISGGQRKRLNIALELIREPAVLFLDEPTSGLSSRDSENIMDLLKELSLKGKLVFVVIHQPSSDIFKMIDKLLILDTGGYLIYNGNPVDSIIYFKSRVHHANWNESECHACGNVNSEQVFNIVEASVLDEYGKLTDIRKISPTEWAGYFEEGLKTEEEKHTVTAEDLPPISFNTPNIIKQFWVFVTRDILKKLSDTQYLAINFLEAPVLAFLLAYIIKYFSVDVSNQYGYTLLENSNLPVYIFMSVIVAIFMGLTVSAEEIIKDRKILKRESFLNLSWSSYLFSKVFVQFVLSAIQAVTFVLIGNTIMEIKGMYLEYWMVLFSSWAFSNIMGLLISDSFKTVVTIYILIPFLVIPQIILSGIIVKYENLNPKISSPKSIPFYGEIITARWAYEALSTYQFMDNLYEQRYYALDKLGSNASFKSDFLINELQNKLRFVEKNYNDPGSRNQIAYQLDLIQNEIIKEHKYRLMLKNDLSSTPDNLFEMNDKLNIDDISPEVITSGLKYLQEIRDFYARLYKQIYNRKNEIRSSEDKELIAALKRNHHNETLEEFVTNKNEFKRIVEYNGELIQKTDPIYLDPMNKFIKAHFYAPRKQIFGKFLPTIWVNLIVTWCMSVLLFIALYFRLLKRFLDYFENLEFGKKDK